MKAKEKRNWFVYVAEIYGTKETLIASGLTQIEAQELHEEYSRNCERNTPNMYATYGNTISHEVVAKRLGVI